MKQIILKQVFLASQVFFLSSILVSCADRNLKKKADTLSKIVTKKNKAPSSYSDTIKIKSVAAVFFYPDSMQLNKMKASTDSMIVKSTDHECYYLMKNARTSLKDNWPKVRVFDASKARYLLFIKQDKSQICIDLNTKNDMCGLFLFDLVKDPLQADMANISTALHFYFLK
jgi:hypothetical protein